MKPRRCGRRSDTGDDRAMDDYGKRAMGDNGKRAMDDNGKVLPLDEREAGLGERKRLEELKEKSAGATGGAPNALPTREENLGRFRVLETIGEGGMGRVLKVLDPRDGHIYAAKIHFEPTHDRTIFLNYRREYGTLKRLRHPYIVRAFEFGIFDHRPFFVMEYVNGIPVAEYLADKAPTPGRLRDRLAINFALQIAEALEYIHHHSLIHRDLKPDNILVTPDARIKLIDFGIAQETAAQAQPTDRALAGTYAYSPPEQFSGVPMDHRSDLYSFGVVLYLMITNAMPFHARHNLGYVVKHAVEPPAPPERAYPGIPPRLRDMILRLLEKRPIERPADAREVCITLQGLLQKKAPDLWRSRRLEEKTVHDRLPANLYEPAFVGRERERIQIEGAVTLLEAGAGGVLLLVGEEGLGKARLMDEALGPFRARGVPVISARCIPDPSKAHQGVAEVVDAIMEDLDDARLELVQTMLKDHLPVLARAFPSISRLLPPDEEGGDANDAHLEFFFLQEGLKAFFEAIPSRPTIIALKDLHWADAATRALIQAVCTAPPNPMSAPILWVGSVDSNPLDDTHPLHAWVHRPPPIVQVTHLAPLADDDAETLLRSMLGTPNQRPPLRDILLHIGGGNPLRLAEALRALVERGRLTLEAGADPIRRWRATTDPASAQELGEITLDQLMIERLRLLPPQAINIVEHMAILDQPCSFDWLHFVTRLSEESLLDLLEDLLARRIITEHVGRRRSVFSLFHHRIVDIIRGHMSESRRRNLHRAVAEALSLTPDRPEESSAELAGLHYYLGGYHERAFPLLLKAAESKQKLDLHDLALIRLQQALECTEHAHEGAEARRTEIKLRMGESYSKLGAYTKAHTFLLDAATLAREEGAQALEADAWMALTDLYARQGEYTRSAKHCRKALALFQATGDRANVIRALLILGCNSFLVGKYQRSHAFTSKALKKAEALQDKALQSASQRGLAELALIDARLQDAHRLLRASLDPSGTPQARLLSRQVKCCDVLRLLGNLAHARRDIVRIVHGLDRLGDPKELIDALLIEASIALDIQDEGAARQSIERIRKLLNSFHHPIIVIRLNLLEAEVEILHGRARTVVDKLKETAGMARRRHYPALEAGAERLLGMAYMRDGRLKAAKGQAESARMRAAGIGHKLLELETRLLAAEIAVVRGRRNVALDALEGLIPGLEKAGLRLHTLRASILAGWLYAGQDRGEEAEKMRARSARLMEAIRRPLTRDDRLLFDRRPEIKRLKVIMRERSDSGS